MRFTLFNLLIANALVAASLGLILGDESHIKKNAAQRASDMQFIARSFAWRKLPSDHQAYQELDRSILFYGD